MNLLINNIFKTKIAHLEVLTLHVLQKLLSLSIIVDPDLITEFAPEEISSNHRENILTLFDISFFLVRLT